MSSFKFSERSLSKFKGAHPDLVKVAKRAIELTEIDFGITEGIRSESRQKELVASGASQTMKSRHITGHAIDVVAYVGGSVRWDWQLYAQIAEAFAQAAKELGIPIVWGGCWEVINNVQSIDAAVAEYVDRKRKQGGKPFLDGPHFELSTRFYPA